MMSRIERTSVTPTQLVTMLEQARARLEPKHPARQYVETALARLQIAKIAEDTVLDTHARIPETPAPRVVEPRYPGEEL